MAEETKTEVPKVTKPSPREIALESALKDAMAMIEDLTVRLQRMGIQVRGTAEWVEAVKKLVSNA